MALPAQAPADEYEPNGHGLYNMCGNVWEWVDGGTKEQRVLRGGSYVDSLEGTFNHAIKVSTRCDHRFPALSAAAADPAADRRHPPCSGWRTPRTRGARTRASAAR